MLFLKVTNMCGVNQVRNEGGFFFYHNIKFAQNLFLLCVFFFSN